MTQVTGDSGDVPGARERTCKQRPRDLLTEFQKHTFFLTGTQRWTESILVSSLHWAWHRDAGSLSGSPHPPRTQSGLLKVRPKMEYPLSHMTSVYWKSSPSKEGVTLQNSSALGLAGFSRKVWEGSRILSAAEPGVQGDAEKTGKTQSWKLFLIRPRAVEQHSRRVSMLSGQPGANDSTSW